MNTARCTVCHRPLTDPYSIAIGMGPDCRGRLAKKGWTFPKPKYRITHGRVELAGMVGKVERPTGDLTARRRQRATKDEGDSE